MLIARPAEGDYPDYTRGYVSLVTDGDVLGLLRHQLSLVRAIAAGVSDSREQTGYAPGKWSIRQVVGHLGDCERVFGYRALAISRSDGTPLPGFDENTYVSNSAYAETPLAELIEELVLLREANLRMLGRVVDRQWLQAGTANGQRITLGALAFVMAGHMRHHLNILQERYGVSSIGSATSIN
jgi:hypothetical protein